jgi:lipoate-protein ligase A
LALDFARLKNFVMHPSWLMLRSGAGEPAWNMALDAALLEAAPNLGRPVLRFYGWNTPAVTFGYFQKYAEIEQATLLRPLIRRPTGGGLVPHDGDWTYSAVFPPGESWYAFAAIESYRRIHEWIQAAFLKIGVVTELAASARKSLPGQCFAGHETFDLLWRGRKIAGAAQRRNKNGLLIQGSVQPPPIDIARADWERAMGEVAETQSGVEWEEFPLNKEFKRRVENLAVKTYSSAEYNHRR